ncbi:hypothetical protein HHK36_027246 [Tetracentron sinense]|uniref:Uncharacterized protein n=1 Tax=Tetracentron sinense TaxID=13715 RepID=A0A834YK45_TETSI|nr:hypothetical protein HHK36_027246 [Tetracentron sinense]
MATILMTSRAWDPFGLGQPRFDIGPLLSPDCLVSNNACSAISTTDVGHDFADHDFCPTRTGIDLAALISLHGLVSYVVQAWGTLLIQRILPWPCLGQLASEGIAMHWRECLYSMSHHRGGEFDYMADEGEIDNAMDEEFHGRGDVETEVDDYDMLTKVTDTSSAQARRGKDIQGIPWDRLNITRKKYRQTRLEQYKNYENLPSSGEVADKECKQVETSGNYYEFRHNSRLVKPTILHFQLRNLVWATSKHDVYLMSNYSVVHWSSLSSNLSEVLNFSGHVAPTEKHQGSLLEGFTQTQISTLAVKDNFLVAGGFQGELTCKVLFDTRLMLWCARPEALELMMIGRRDSKEVVIVLVSDLEAGFAELGSKSMSPVELPNPIRMIRFKDFHREDLGAQQRDEQNSKEVSVVGISKSASVVWPVCFEEVKLGSSDAAESHSLGGKEGSPKYFLTAIPKVNADKMILFLRSVTLSTSVPSIPPRHSKNSNGVDSSEEVGSNYYSDHFLLLLSKSIAMPRSELDSGRNIGLDVIEPRENLTENLFGMVFGSPVHYILCRLGEEGLLPSVEGVYGQVEGVEEEDLVEVPSPCIHSDLSEWVLKKVGEFRVFFGGLSYVGHEAEYVDRRGVSFCTKTTSDENAITNAVDIYESLSGGIRFVTSNNDCAVREYDVERFQLLNHFHFPWPVNHTSMSPDRKLIIVVGDNLNGYLLDSQSGKEVSSLVGHRDYSFASAWHPDGNTFATGNQDKTCRLWDTRKLSLPIAVLKGNLGAVRSIRFSLDGQFMAVAEPADFVHIYSTKADYKMRQEIDFFGEISGISLSPDDESLFIGVWDRTYASLLQYSRRHTYRYLDSYV